MASPLRPSLYRSQWRAVICAAVALIAAQFVRAQSTHKNTVKGPRAVGLVQLAPNGKARLVPIAILIDGKFYDASVYKADPVPYALESEVVYEAVRTGVSQGLFTVTGALQGQNTWLGEGTWQAAGATPKKKAIAKEEKPNLSEDAGPPRLRKRGDESATTPAPPSQPSPSPQSSPTASAPSTPPPPTSQTTPAPAKPDTSADTSGSPGTSSAEDDNDPNRPVLRRGKTQPLGGSSASRASAPASPSASSTSAKSASKDKSPVAKAGTIQLIPAISDAHGPEPRPYSFEMKPDEEEQYRKKILALAAAEVQKKAVEMTPVMPSAAPPKRTTSRPAAKQPAPTFDNVQFRAFDLWNNNQPVFVLSADAHLPAMPAAASPEPRTYTITLVANADIYLDLHKMLVDVTDQQHLDEFPKLELIDAVDADGDGRGDLLFRQVSDAGTAWVIYRATVDTLFLLFEGSPTKVATVAP